MYWKMEQDKPVEKRKLNVDLDELQIAFELHAYEVMHYLDRQTGEILMVDEEARSLLEEAYGNLLGETLYR